MIINQSDFDSLVRWYDANQRDLPWRREPTPYQVTVSEMMLQQTTVAAVTPLYLRWMSRFPDFPALADAPLEEVMRYWSGLGYYQRARRLWECAKHITRRGSFPETYQELLDLPGLGPYTAAAVASIAFSEPALALDTNVIRVLFRYHGIAERADHKASQERLRRLYQPVLERLGPGRLNQALMELGATICAAREARCLACSLAGSCSALAQNRQNQLPLKKEKRPARLTPGTVFVLEQPQKGLLVVKGTTLGLLKELYQPPILFPETVGLGSSDDPLIGLLEQQPTDTTTSLPRLTYGISGRKLQLQLKVLEMTPPLSQALAEHDHGKWYDPDRPKLPVSSLTRKIVKAWRGSL